MARRALLVAELPLRLKWPTAFLIGSSLVAEDGVIYYFMTSDIVI